MADLATSYSSAGRLKDALELDQQLLPLRAKVLGPLHVDTLASMNAIAWIQATSPMPGLRNGTNAVRLMETAVAATTRTNGQFLDTLAAAYAEAGQFEKASAAEQEAIALLQTPADKKDCASRLALYQANQPFRAPSNGRPD
jgi:tetratricopeptide (TPR) repeat protein